MLGSAALYSYDSHGAHANADGLSHLPQDEVTEEGQSVEATVYPTLLLK